LHTGASLSGFGKAEKKLSAIYAEIQKTRDLSVKHMDDAYSEITTSKVTGSETYPSHKALGEIPWCSKELG